MLLDQQLVQGQRISSKTCAIVYDADREMGLLEISLDTNCFGLGVAEGVLTGLLHNSEQVLLHMGIVARLTLRDIESDFYGVISPLRKFVRQLLKGGAKPIGQHGWPKIVDDLTKVCDDLLVTFLRRLSTVRTIRTRCQQSQVVENRIVDTTSQASPLYFLPIHIGSIKCVQSLGLSDVHQSNGGLIGNGLENEDVLLAVPIVRITTSQQPKADQLFSNPQGQNQPHPVMRIRIIKFI